MFILNFLFGSFFFLSTKFSKFNECVLVGTISYLLYWNLYPLSSKKLSCAISLTIFCPNFSLLSFLNSYKLGVRLPEIIFSFLFFLFHVPSFFSFTSDRVLLLCLSAYVLKCSLGCHIFNFLELFLIPWLLF